MGRSRRQQSRPSGAGGLLGANPPRAGRDLLGEASRRLATGIEPDQQRGDQQQQRHHRQHHGEEAVDLREQQ